MPLKYNLIYLFNGQPNADGSIYFTLPPDGRGAATNWKADIQTARTTQGRKIILSVGGAGNGFGFPDRTHSQNFVNSVIALYNAWGGFDGLDWDNYEGATPTTSEMIWVSQQLKAKYPGFLITSPPAPWNTAAGGDLDFCKAMLNASPSALDYCGPQYYDGPGLADPTYIESNIKTWVTALGANHVVVGFGLNAGVTNYSTLDQVKSAWTSIRGTYPTIRGGFDWAISTDETQGWPFGNTVGALINP